jgi:dienelactone hydrolase
MKPSTLVTAVLLLSACQSPATKEKNPPPKTQETTKKMDPTSNPTDASAGSLLFVGLLAKGSFGEAEKMFSPEMKAAVPSGGLQQIWNGLLAQGGSHQKSTVSKTFSKETFNIAIVTAEFLQLTVDLQVVFDTKGLVSGFRMVRVEPKAVPYDAPSYVKADSYEEKELSIGEGTEWALAGTLTTPKGAGPFAVVILVHGSGPHDRDESIGLQKPFKDLALGLASQGVAVFRYEKRTKAHGAKMTGAITMNEETVEDAALAVAMLEKQPSIDPKQIYVAGHSQGGLAIPRIGVKAPQAAGLIIMAGPTRAFEDIITDQVTYIAGLDGNVSHEEEIALEQLKEAVKKVKDPALNEKTPAQELPLNIPASFWLDLRDYKPAEILKGLPQRTLVLQGERDYQVIQEDLDGWKKGTEGKKNITFQTFADLNHTFVTGTGKATPAEYEKEGHVAESVINTIATWVKTK